MIRTTDLMSYLPVFYREKKEMAAVQAALNPEIQVLEDETEIILNNQFIVTADENGIGLFEKLLQLHPLDNDTLENRRFRVLSRWNRYVPYTKRTLKQKLETLCGSERYSIAFSAEEKLLTIRVSLHSRRNFEDVKRMLEEIVPLNVDIDLSLSYNQNHFLAKLPHFRLADYTHYQLRNEIMEFFENGSLKRLTNGQLKQFTQNAIRKGEL